MSSFAKTAGISQESEMDSSEPEKITPAQMRCKNSIEK
jgi:hypothetical protein